MQRAHGRGRALLDLHFQSARTAPVVLDAELAPALRDVARGAASRAAADADAPRGVWVVTGTGHHVARGSHQVRGGKLFDVAKAYLEERGFTYLVGKDRNGYAGAFLVTGYHAGAGP